MAIALFAAILLAGGAYVVFDPKVVDTAQYAALYSNNTAEIIFRDTYRNDVQVYRGEIEPIFIDEQRSLWGWGAVGYVLPKITLRGGNEKRVVFTVQDDSGEEVCDRTIFYVNREAHTSYVAHTPRCIVRSLDQKDHTRFWTQEYVGFNETEHPYFAVGVGEYSDGHLIASTSVPVPVWTDGVSSIGWYGINPGSVVSDWEMTKIVFAFTAGPECGDFRGECDTPAFIYMLDLASGEVRDVTPEKEVTYKTLYPYGDINMSTLQYVRDNHEDPASGRFIIVGDNGYDDPYAVISVDEF